MNYGKKFEQLIRKQFEQIRQVSIDRINDNVGYAGAYNIADLIVYRKPNKYYLELKTVKGISFPFSNINEKSLRDMQYASLVNGVGCYFLIWFRDLDRTIAINCQEIYLKMYGQNKKSIGIKSFEDFEFIEVTGIKKRTYFNYNLNELLDKFDGEM